MADERLLDRPPRIQPELPIAQIPLPKPPNPQEDRQARLVQIVLPLITIIGYVLVSSLGASGRNPWLLLPMALSVLASTAFSIYSYRHEQRQRREADQAYADRLVELGKELHQAHGLQRRFYEYNYPSPQVAFDLTEQAHQPTGSQPTSLRSVMRLWERRVADHDFGYVRLGIGSLPSTVIYQLSGIEEFSSAHARAARKLADDSLIVSEAPFTVALRQAPEVATPSTDETSESSTEDLPPMPYAPALALAGQSQGVYDVARAIIAHAVVFHAPADLRLFLCADQKAPWAWAEQLPHARPDEQDANLLFLDAPTNQTTEQEHDDDVSERERFFEGLRKLLAQRKIRLQEHEEQPTQGSPTQPFCLVIVDMLNGGSPSELSDIEADAAISILLTEGAALGTAVIFLVPERSKAPSGCQGVVEIETTTPNTNSKTASGQRLHFRYAEIGLNSVRAVGLADRADLALMHRLAALLATRELRQGPGLNLPTSVPLLELEGLRSLNDVRSSAQHAWQSSEHDVRRANWLRVRLGRMAGNKPRQLVFSAKRDGVHGMVAGSTGSGKSELLISLISGMAINYSPATLNFVLVDYKGGGAFSEFAHLPHCVDIITNLAGDGVTRMFTAITAEMQRRQRLNVATRTKNIVDYRRKGFHLSGEPYPFLFIIIDEFAEMIADRAEYKAQLESITRVGRAQGVSLILAAQRPSGVTDQMRSNIKFRICLRVETPPESREMLRRPDAAYLPPGVPGRGYLQVGNEHIELIQVAYSGDRAHLGERANVIWPDRSGGYDPNQDREPPELYKAIIENLAELAQRSGVPRQRAPWPSPLPVSLSLTEPLIAQDPQSPTLTAAVYLDDESLNQIRLGVAAEPVLTLGPALNRWLEGSCGWVEPLDVSYTMRPVIGLVDNPYAARQLPLVVDLQRGHAVVFGASGWGKSSMLRTMALSLAASHSLNLLHIYLLDLGGRSLSGLGGLPHVGALITPDDASYAERVTQLIRRCNELIDTRKALVSAAGFESIYDYNRANPTSRQPSILLILDNLLEFVESFSDPGDAPESVLDQFTALARQARVYGIHLVISANRLEDLPNQLTNLFTERFALKMAEAGDYRAILGATVAEFGDLPGRGYTRVGNQPLAFQAALPFELKRADGLASPEMRELDLLIQRINDHVANEQAAGRSFRAVIRVDALPKKVPLPQLLAEQYYPRLPLDQNMLSTLPSLMQEAWQASTKPEQADWLRVAFGVMAGGRTRTLRFEAKADGVHALVAGGTGAGKSELLMSIVVGLALRYDPSVLNFVLIDYKGGGAFAPFEQLPHCVDILTNLHKPAVRRVFTAIRAELERRQELLRTDGDIVKYRQAGRHQGAQGQPLPFLMIIIDEYAELITDNPEFGEELDRITRLGRSLGVHLILASQRPTGVSDQMRANIKLRICLRVEGPETSRELLRRADAAFLPNGMPGRGYLQVGSEHLELIQVAYAGDSDPYGSLNDRGEPARFFESVVRITRTQWGKAAPTAPWPPPLPTALTFGERGQPGLTPLLVVSEWFRGRRRWPTVNGDETFLRPVIGMLDDPVEATQRPLTLDLQRGHAVIFGASGWGKSTVLRSLAVSLTASYPPTMVHIHVLDLGGRDLSMLRELPHVGTIISPDERGYEEQVQQLLSELRDLVDGRKRRFNEAGVNTLLEYNAGPPTNPNPAQNPLAASRTIEPAVVLLIDNLAELLDTFGGNRERSDGPLEQLISLARQGRPYGIHLVITAARPAALSNKLYSLFTERFTLRLADPSEYGVVVGSNPGDLEELAGRGMTRWMGRALVFQIALIPGALDAQGRVRGEPGRIRQLGHSMHEAIESTGETITPPLRIQALPNELLFRNLLVRQHDQPYALTPLSVLDDLRELAQHNWARQASPQAADWLQLTPGLVAGEKPRTLVLSAKQDGVHGLIAGTSGSGKSELLMTMILSLALRYSPEELTFVLVDFKGGGAFKPFEQLPHCVDIVTNLNRSAVHRMFTAIEAEIRRRQALNAASGVSHIVEYRKRGYHLSREPYPHLVIIIDEYAEMIDTNPEYRQQLDSITRVGRSIGINLFLASQRPKGVSDQMRANIKLRICLRVEDAETSRELLRRPDAALLPSIPGRGVLQVGNDNSELIQIAWAGNEQPDLRPAAVIWPERPTPPERIAEQVPNFLDRVVAMSHSLARDLPITRPWHGFLPSSLSLETPHHDVKHNQTVILNPTLSDWVNGDSATLWPGVNWADQPLTAVAGLIDDPQQADQRPLLIDLAQNHLAIFGDPKSGKSTLLRTLTVDLAARYRPDELHLYAVDLGGRSLRPLEGLPHLGSVIYADEERFDERIQRLFEILSALADERQRLFSEAGCQNLSAYHQRYPERICPAIVVLIDSLVSLREGYESLVEGMVLPLVRRSLGVGISFVVACNTPASFGSRLYGLFNERLTFNQTDPDRYMEIVGRGTVSLDGLPGRGYGRSADRPLLIQAALPLGWVSATGQLGRAEADELAELGRMMQQASDERQITELPDPVEVLADQLDLTALLHKLPPPDSGYPQLVLGYNSSLQPVLVNLQQMGPHVAILGPARSGKTTAIRTLALALAQRYSPEQVLLVLIDLQGRLAEYGGQQRLDRLPNVLISVTEPEQLEDLANRLERAAQALKAAGPTRPQLVVLLDNAEELFDLIEQQRLSRQLAMLARSFGRYGVHWIMASSPETQANDLRRNILAPGLGVGLRSAASVEALKVVRTPTALRNRELPIGRGFLVKAGQAQQIQFATPYPEVGSTTDPHQANQIIAAAMDRLISSARQRWSGQKARWPSMAQAPSQGPVVQPLDQLRDLLQAMARSEWQAHQTDPSWPTPILEHLIQPGVWHNPDALIEVGRIALVQLEEPGLRSMVADLYADFDESNILDMLRAKWQPPAEPEPETNQPS
ncbi:MAG: FtsK/SpoIIIE domain-containing protein [Oscillochloridaceae bacterium umkhey_bin13]